MAKILIVDDEIQFIKMTQLRLESSGYEVIWAYNGEEGLSKAKSEMPDLIILDLMMPVMDGYTMLKELRMDGQIKNIPVMLCSAKMVQEIEEIRRKLGADGCMKKPFDSAEFLAKVKALLS